MRPSFLIFTLIAFALLAASGEGQEKKPGEKKLAFEDDLRCAYVGQQGSFHLVGSGGSAAYRLGGQEYVATLRSNGQDANFWYFTPANGDPDTTQWAFDRKPDICGMYWVFRGQGKSWHAYEPTRAWGKGLGGDSAKMTFVSPETRITILEGAVERIQERVEKLEKKN